MQNRFLRNFNRFTVAGAILPLLWATSLLAAPPYDINITFDPPVSGGPAEGYNLYIDDCAASGPTGSPFGAVTSGQTFVGALTADGVYEVCVRSFNAAGEIADPGPVATIDVSDLPLPGPVENLDVTVACPNGGCSVTITVN